MKKIYIAPGNTVVRINVEKMVAASPNTPEDVNVDLTSESFLNQDEIGARKSISAPDAWDEW